MIVEGAIAVKSSIDSRYRKVNKIYIDEDKHSSDVSFIVKQAYQDRLPVERCTRAKIDSLASGKTHGGIIADVEERRFQSLMSLLTKEKPVLFLVEGVEDSYNLGYIFRSLYAFGCDGVILPEREWHFEDGTMVKSSAGASEFIPIHLSQDLNETLSILKNNGVKIYSAYRGGNCIDIFKADYTKSGVLMCIGGPLRGLSREVLDNSDQFVYIPYANDFRNALNAASAAVVAMAEIYRQNH